MCFGERLKKLRREKKVTQQELADYLDVGRSAIAGYETKKKHPTYDKLRLIARFFEVSTDYLLGVDNSCNNNRVLVEPKVTSVAPTGIEDLPKEALVELENFIDFLKFKYKV